MLNISKNSVHKDFQFDKYKSGKVLANKMYFKAFNRFLWVFLIILFIISFLPWTQNVSGSGTVTTLKPNHRPQTIQSQIPGRIEEWYINEGDFVRKGDTIVRISEVKSDYFDDKLLERTGEQVVAKKSTVEAYSQKMNSLKMQRTAILQEKGLKIQQSKNKIMQARYRVISDSIDLVAAETNLTVAKTRWTREINLAKEGLKSTKDVESRRLKLQATQSKYISVENKLLESRNKWMNAKMEILRLNAEYADKLAKASSDIYSAESYKFGASADVSKLENALSNYSKRRGLLYVTAPQDGFINKALVGGIGETFKEGEKLLSIMPSNYELAVETYVAPIDLPLIHIGESVRVQFDGWPAIVFKGWENVSYGTYGAKVVAIENSISDNGKYRVLLAADKKDHTWPKALRVGSGAKTIALLNDVPVWYELWRQLNGFPPNFYQPKKASAK